MKAEIKRLEVLQTGKVLAALYGVVTIVWFPVALVSAIGEHDLSSSVMLHILLYPVIGFVAGVIIAFSYNKIVVRWTGGLRLTLEQTE